MEKLNAFSFYDCMYHVQLFYEMLEAVGDREIVAMSAAEILKLCIEEAERKFEAMHEETSEAKEDVDDWAHLEERLSALEARAKNERNLDQNE